MKVAVCMKVDFFHYHVNFSEEKREITLLVKVGALQISDIHKKPYGFNPRLTNEIILDYDSGKVKNPNSLLCFYAKTASEKPSKEEWSIAWLLEHVIGFSFELEQAYDKALFYRAMGST